MNLINTCCNELMEQNLFENLEHRSRFSELIHCYGKYPFFNKGLCKCMYLSSWDMDHFIILLDTLNRMTLDSGMNIEEMKAQGRVIEQSCTGYDRYIMQLSHDFLNDVPYQIPDVELPEECLHIMKRALEVSDVLDRIFREYHESHY